MDLGRFLIEYQKRNPVTLDDTECLPGDMEYYNDSSENTSISAGSKNNSELPYTGQMFSTLQTEMDTTDLKSRFNSNFDWLGMKSNELQTTGMYNSPSDWFPQQYKYTNDFPLDIYSPFPFHNGVHKDNAWDHCSHQEPLISPSKAPIYKFPLASRLTSNSLFKIALNHTVAGLYIGKHGTNLKRLQSTLNFGLTQSGRGSRGDFTGVGYPCHRTNTALLFEGTLVDILMALRPLYRIIQNEVLTLDKESQRIVSGRVLNVKFELDVIIPLDRKKLLMQEEGVRCNRLRQLSGVGIIAGKQNYEWGNIKETIVTLYGFAENVEKACEWLGVFIQESPAVLSRDFAFIDYPKYTLAVPENAFS
ncbi:uncharacterized protein BBOV_IV009220 [Babesia bovis T2Bo]|uniref:K Homology domain-containing protein n=1 Tax=Babesia bovis TaxID=5865 RepID=A7ARV7_BABBO|nr:uncharacterized protein BBOV_IV009220 [Babesia bovis T2Bo]EDO07276.1 hypothetical protein BBOV_IV009220 [Babesia bovis T2Bo]|eukprot:XP_001610844.1 hypothetical protein [Babesia bovis T2Bo]